MFKLLGLILKPANWWCLEYDIGVSVLFGSVFGTYFGFLLCYAKQKSSFWSVPKMSRLDCRTRMEVTWL